ncbi:hypothetical protein [Tenacibaculum maritimum]|uniref:hypothetical protein n=1 Tax=Tenacibaculum maritimum TaxID=107401 RepID=UPI0012E5EB4B|nr:hypothetical protein [Tenacibaculum maritimum]CAA0186231.1 conserved hypothetical protein [Tenacibaculum maritimum]
MKNENKIINIDATSIKTKSTLEKLSKLKPAGTKLILESKSDLIELIKLTLFDLTLKKVLVIKKKLKKSHPRDPYLREYIIVETGKNFSKYSPDKFEKYFTNIIDNDSYYHLRSYVNTIFKEISSEYKYKKEIISNLEIRTLFKDNLILSILSYLSINKKGKEFKKEVKKYLDEVDSHIPDLIENKPEKALQLILFLKGNIFLLNNLKLELLEKLKLVETKQMNHSDDYYYDWLRDSTNLDSNLISEITEMVHSIDDYVNFSSGSDLDSGYDFDY